VDEPDDPVTLVRWGAIPDSIADVLGASRDA
jgi:hypothetical protein